MNDLTAIVLAGGYGKRLWPLAFDKPKTLLEIGRKPILQYLLYRMEELGVTRSIISTNLKFEREIRAWLDEHGYPEVEVIVDPSFREDQKPGAVASLANITARIRSDCLVLAGDNLFTSSLSEMTLRFFSIGSPLVAVYDVVRFDLARRFAPVVLDPTNRIIELSEKPRDPKTTLVALGIYLLPKRILPLVHEYVEADANHDEPGRFLQWLCIREPIYAYPLGGMWWDIGTYDSYLQASAFFEKDSSKDLLDAVPQCCDGSD